MNTTSHCKHPRRWAIAAGLALVVGGAGLAVRQLQRPLAFEPSQRATLSSQAIAFLTAARIPRVADFVVLYLVSEKAVLDGQAKLVESERPFEDAIIARYGLKLEKVVVAGVPVTIVTPPAITPGNENAVAIDIHGGGFTSGTSRDRTALHMAHDMGIRVYSIDYTLAPEAKYPVAVEQCLAVYRTLVEKLGAHRIVGLSSSSGGNTMLSMLQKARAQGLPMIAGLGFFTPASDISGAGDSTVANDGRDVVPANMALYVAQRFYAPGMDLHDTGLSPLYGTYDATFPPSVITTGTRDLLLSNAVRLNVKLEDAGVRTHFVVMDGMWHGYNWELDLPEGIRARAQVAKFLNTELRRGADPVAPVAQP